MILERIVIDTNDIIILDLLYKFLNDDIMSWSKTQFLKILVECVEMQYFEFIIICYRRRDWWFLNRRCRFATS